MDKVKIILGSVLLLIFSVSNAQVGINTTNPDSSAVLELKSIRRGFLLPRMTTSQRMAISEPANGLFVFDTEDKMFYFYDSTYVTPSYGWTGLSPWIFKDDRSNKDLTTGLFMRDLYTHKSVRSIGIGTSVPVSDNAFTVANNVAIGDTVTTAPENGLLVKGEVIAESDVTVDGTVEATTFVGNGIIPVGGIIMWSGSTEPDGWKLCDGNNNVKVNGITIPDLQGRFIVGAGTKKVITRNQNGTYSEGSNHTYTLGTDGGADEVKMSIDEMPSHNHGVTDPGHEHTVTDRYSNGSEKVHDITTQDRAATDSWNEDTRTTSEETTGITINDNGGDDAHENRPPYYVLAYLIRVE